MMRLNCLAIAAGLVCTLFLTMAADATVVKNIYVASVPAANQSSAARAKALHNALTAVLVKVTGSRAAVSSPALTDFLAHPERALQRYRYERVQPVRLPGKQPKAHQRQVQPVLHLWTKFDSASVNQALQSAGLPIWGRERPVTLVWIAKQGGEARNILGADNNAPLEAFLKRKARRRGMGITLPLMDLQDQREVSFSDIAGGFNGRIRNASARYSPDGILIGNLYTLAPGEWTAKWQLLLGGDTVTWKTPPGRLGAVSADGINGAANYYAGHFALQSNNSGARGVEVEVSGVGTVAAYAHVLDFLKSLTPVRHLQVERVTGKKVRFRLNARGELANLRDAISLGEVLAPEKQAARNRNTRSTSRPRKSRRASAHKPAITVLRYHYTP